MAFTNPDQQDDVSFRQFADCLPQIIWACTADGLCNYLSHRWEEYTGTSATEQLGARWLHQIHSDDREQLMHDWMVAINAGEVIKKVFRIRRHDGIFHWFKTHGLPVRDASGQIIRWLGSCTDIQEQIEMREAAYASEQRFKGLYQSAPVSIWQEDWSEVFGALTALRAMGITDFKHYFQSNPLVVTRMLESIKVLDVNDWTIRMFGAQHKAQLLGSPGFMYATPETLDGFISKLADVAAGAHEDLHEMDVLTLDGQHLHVLTAMLIPARDSGSGVVLVSRVDITARHRAEQQLREQRVLLERMSNLAKVGGWGFDVTSMQGTWTDEVARIHDLEPTVAVSAHDGLSFFHDESRQKIEAAVQAAIAHAQPYDLELQMRTAANASKWIRTQSVPIVQNGRVIRLEGAIQDITARKQAELALQALNGQLEQQVAERTADADHARLDLQATLDAIPAVVVYLDHELRARYANLAANRFLGRSIAEVHGKTFAEILGDAHYARRKPYFDAALQGVAQTFEAELPRTAEMASRFAQIHFIPAMRQERVQGLYVMFFDITNLKTAESGLRAANQELEAFSYAVAHDLRAPLRAMNGFSCALLEDCTESLDEFAREYANEIVSASNRMSELLDGLLTLSRSTQGSMRRDLVDLTLIAERIRDELQNTEPQRTVQWQIAAGLRTFGDAHMLELVLQNLLSNAWKYSNRNAQSLITFDSESRDGVPWFRVTDNGAGFDMAHADRLFKPFQRLHRQDEFIGIGVGLATVQRIVHRHGGQIRADAAPGKGASFYFTLGINPVYAGVA